MVLRGRKQLRERKLKRKQSRERGGKDLNYFPIKHPRKRKTDSILTRNSAGVGADHGTVSMLFLSILLYLGLRYLYRKIERYIFPPWAKEKCSRLYFPAVTDLIELLPPGLQKTVGPNISVARFALIYQPDGTLEPKICCICIENECCFKCANRPHSLYCIAWKAYATEMCYRIYK
ncbi:ORF25 hypothetical protein [Psittacine adenovirus 2]|nr:ORF25 hypothetical protein [Psittacine adenovirus 2]